MSRGEICEQIALDYYLKKNFRLYRRRWKSPFAEVDLLLKAPSGEFVLVEVKSVPSLEYLHVRLSQKQKSRLRRALLYCLEKSPGTRMELAVVSQQGQVQSFHDIFD